jgi:hypothetical protein
MDKEGALYGGDPSNAKADAEKWANDYIEGQRQKTAANRAAAEAMAQQNADARGRQRSAARGVAPESLPMDEYGSVSGRTVQEANRPQDEAEAVLAMEQDAADRIARGLREGTPTFEAQGDLDFLRERGDKNPTAGPGRTDMAMRSQIRERRGQYYEMPDGTRIPVGREPTAADIRAEREWQDWTNEAPGTERQALYAPEEYERFREGVRNDIRDNARRDMATYGTGPDWKLQAEADEAMRTAEAAEVGQFLGGLSGPTQNMLRGPLVGTDLARLTPGNTSQAGAQLAARQERKASEERVRNAQRGRFYEERLRADAGLAPQSLGPNPTIDQLERAAYTQRYTKRQRELEARKQNRIDQAMMAGGQPTGGPFGTRATTTAINQLGDGWREIALLDRLTNGRVGGPTPLGVDAVGAQNAMRAFTADVLAGNQPGVREQREIAAANAEAGLPIPVRADRERDKNNGVLPANSAAGQAVLQDIATTTIGSSYATQDEFDRAVGRAVAEGIPEADAIAFFNRHAQFANSGFWGTILGAGNFGAPPAARPAAPPMPIPGGVGPAESLPPAGR